LLHLSIIIQYIIKVDFLQRNPFLELDFGQFNPFVVDVEGERSLMMMTDGEEMENTKMSIKNFSLSFLYVFIALTLHFILFVLSLN
jgi:hypothetical protein